MKWPRFFTSVSGGARLTALMPSPAGGLPDWLLGPAWVISSAASAKARNESSAAPLDQHREHSATARSPPPDAGMIERFRRAMIPQLDAAYSLARYLVRDQMSAEDCVQDAYVRALRAFANYRGGDARSWILAIVRNCCMTWISSRSSERTVIKEGYDADALETIGAQSTMHPLHAAPPAPDAELASLEEADLLRGLIAALSPPLREVLLLREIEELSYREIAAIIDAPIGTVMSRLARARAQLAAACQQLDSAGENP